MQKRVSILLLASVALAMLFSCTSTASTPVATQQYAAQQRSSAAQPNIVFVLADDMRYDDLEYMPKTRSLLEDKGMSFGNAFVSNALCCPSRATIMRGQYSHNTGVWTNGGDEGGRPAYKSVGGEQDNVATRLDAAGYRTGLFGKYLNGYRDTTYVPPGWDEWFVWWGSSAYFDYDVNDDGQLRHFGTGRSDYKTDVLRRRTEAFIGASAAQGESFFAYVAPYAPHMPAGPAPRDKHAYDSLKAPRSPSLNEQDVSDKPSWIRQLPRLTYADTAAIDERYEKRIESLQAVDDLVEGIVSKLNNAGVLSNTYIFFTSDNGFHLGEHRIPKWKGRPYEEDVHVPLVVRGPGVVEGSTTNKLALNTDYLPTFTALAGAQTPSYADGRSLVPVLEASATRATWRSAILLEGRKTPNGGSTPAHYGIRTGTGSKYIEYKGGMRELYDLDADPYELTNKYDVATPPNPLAARLKALKKCSADTCRKAENGQ